MSEDMIHYDRREFVEKLQNDPVNRQVKAEAAAAQAAGLPIESGNAVAIRLDWLLKSTIKLIADGKKYMDFIVKEEGEKGNWVVKPTKEYKLFADGIGDEGTPTMAEDFPPVIWPEE